MILGSIVSKFINKNINNNNSIHKLNEFECKKNLMENRVYFNKNKAIDFFRIFKE